MRTALGLLCALGLACALAACSSSSKSQTATPTAGPADASPLATAKSDPTVVGNTVTFPAKAYTAEVPDGWTFDANDVTVGNISADTMIAPADGGSVRTSIALTCEALPPGITTGDYVQAKLNTVAKFAQGDIKKSVIQVSGQDAAVMEYEQVRGEVDLDKRDVVVVDKSCGWTLSLTTTRGRLAEFTPLFDEFLAKFTFT